MFLNISSLLVVKKNEKKQSSCQEKRDMFGKKLDRPLKYFFFRFWQLKHYDPFK